MPKQPTPIRPRRDITVVATYEPDFERQVKALLLILEADLDSPSDATVGYDMTITDLVDSSHHGEEH